MNDILLIIGMMIATYSVRWFLFGLAQNIIFPPWFIETLHFVPVAVLTALLIPMVISPHNTVWISINNPYLISAIVAAGIAWKWNNLLLTIVLGLGVFLLLNILYA